MGGLDKTIKKQFFYIITILLILIMLIGCIEITPRYPDDSSDDKSQSDDNVQESPNEDDDGSDDEGSEDNIIQITLSDYLKSPSQYLGSKISFHAWFDKIEDNVLFIDDHIIEDSYRCRLPDWLDESFFTPANSDGYTWVGKPFQSIIVT